MALSPQQKLKRIREIKEQMAANERAMEEAKALAPFWFYEPSNGVISSDGIQLLNDYLKPEDIPQHFDSQLDVHLSTTSISGAFGGNQGGKTTLGAIEAFIWTTGEVPLSLKDIYPKEKIPTTFPQHIRVETVDYNTLSKIVLPTYQYWCPKEYIQGGWEKNYSSEHRLLKLGKKGQLRGTIDFMTNKQDVESHQGPPRHGMIYDEEPRYDIYKENLMRFVTADRLKILFTMTPTKGMCFDCSTEILTQEGWKKYYEVSLGDEVLTFNRDKRQLEWDCILGLYYDPNYKDAMIHLTSQSFDALVTSDHRWPVLCRQNNELKTVITDELKTHHMILRAAEFIDAPQEKIYSDAFVELAGWVIGDGTFQKGKRYVTIYQSQTRYPQKCERIKQLLDKSGCQWRERRYPYTTTSKGIASHFIISGEVAIKLRELFPGKIINPEFLVELTKEQLKLFYQGLMDADGYYGKDCDQFGQKTWDNIDGFQMLCVLLGKQVTATVQKDKIHVNVQTSTRYHGKTSVNSLKQEKIYRHEPIWCAQTNNTTLVARRNGSVYITGNTWIYDEIFMKAEDEHGHNINCFKIPSITNKKANLLILRELLDGQGTYDEIRMKLLGEFISLSGFVYGALFNKSVHLIPSFDLIKDGRMDDYTIYRGLDPHLTTPTACVEIAIDREGFEYVIGCYTGNGDTEEIKSDLAQRAKERKYRLGWTACDKSADSNIKILGDRNIFLELSRGKNAVPAMFTSEKFTGSAHAGVNEIKKLLKIDPKVKKPKLVFLDIPENKPLITAMRTLERDRARDEEVKGERDKINDQKYHAHACLRYLHQRKMSWMPPVEDVPQYEYDNESIGW